MYYGNNPNMIYFENVRGNVKEYFEKRKKLKLLAYQPETIMTKKTQTSASRIYGFPMQNAAIKAEGANYIRDWLLESVGIEGEEHKLNLHNIFSTGLLKELIAFNYDDNFDRVMGFMGAVIGREENLNQYIKKQFDANEKKHRLDFLTKNKALFSNV